MLPKVTIRRGCWLLAAMAVCAALSAGDPQSSVPQKPPNTLQKTSSGTKTLGEPKLSGTPKSPESKLDTKSSLSSLDQETFAEPYRTIQVATTDMGIVREVLIHEGETVEADQPLVKLDEELVKASQGIAQQNLASRGALNSAEAELRLNSSRVEKFDALVRSGHARTEELERARMEKDVATARVLIAQEALSVRQRELERTQIELERRTVRSPLNGVVTKIHREVGEFVAPSDPVVVTIVQLDPLLATFSLKPAQASQLRAGRSVQVQFSSVEQPVKAEVELVSPITDARSGTVRVKVRIPNSQGTCRSGDRCTLLIPEHPTSPQATNIDKDKPQAAKRIR